MLYSQDLRKRVVAAVHQGMKKTVVSRTFNVCRQTIYSWLKLEKEQGNLQPITGFQKGHSHSIKDDNEFKRFVNEHPDYTQKEIAEHFNVGSSSVDRMLKRLGYSRKKSQTYAERSEEKRKVYSDSIKHIDNDKIVYVDESGMNDNDFYSYAYSPIGTRHYESKPGHYSKRISMIGGLCGKQFQAPFMFEGHCNTVTFETYVEKVLVSSLKPGMSVVIDNASFHKSAKIKKMIEDAGCQLIFLPPYSPDLNPIEHYWHKIKTKIRKLMRDAKETLNQAMEITLKMMSTC